MLMNWNERIEAARANGGFTIADTELAGSWVTCACGEQDSRIPHSYYGMPLDNKLSEYGISFCCAVVDNIFDVASELLAKIETRATQILSDLEE